ncbi:hypothetical protein DM02DRAFT_727142 [Periconia macrospinosa]|uniref:Mid2 domain-containing protein n=1 Tax=Periconia macrospinosa TaxID=97972 RepID=A0A2V1DWD2_9PLEO|nr:hypothetical protein DM02DRAFT_727142 [Periconia macrospinosa]
MDLRGEKTQMLKPISGRREDPSGSKQKETSTTALPDYPQIVCPPSYTPVPTESVISAASLWVYTNTYTSCVSLIDHTSNDTAETHWTRAPCSLRTETYSGDEKVSVLTFCASMTSTSSPSSAVAVTTTGTPNLLITTSSSNGPTSTPTATPTSIASPGLHWEPHRNNNIIAIVVTVPLVSIALLFVLVYFFYYRRKKNYRNDQQGSSSGVISARKSSASTVVAGVLGNRVSEFGTQYSTRTSNRTSNKTTVVDGLGVHDEEEYKRRWTKGGFRMYGDGVSRRPPPLSPKALVRSNSNANGDSESGNGSRPYSYPYNAI